MPEHEANELIKTALAQHSLKHLSSKYEDQLNTNAAVQQIAEKCRLKNLYNLSPVMSAEVKTIYLDLLEEQRQWLLEKNQSDPHFDEDIIRKYLHQLDIEEEKFRFM